MPKGAEVDLAVRVVRTGRARGPSVMIVEDLKGWSKEAKRDKESVGRIWELVVRLVQVVFRDRTVPVDIAWANIFLAPSGGGGVHWHMVGRGTV